MKCSITTPSGELFQSECEFVLVHRPEGEFAMMEDHIPIISTVSKGFIKVRNNQTETFIALVGGVVEMKDNNVTIIAQSAATASSKDQAEEQLTSLQNKMEEENRRMNKEFAINEVELARNIKKAKGGKFS
jgi:F-type H+-transporting ATPase subunit epsilon